MLPERRACSSAARQAASVPAASGPSFEHDGALRAAARHGELVAGLGGQAHLLVVGLGRLVLLAGVHQHAGEGAAHVDAAPGREGRVDEAQGVVVAGQRFLVVAAAALEIRPGHEPAQAQVGRQRLREQGRGLDQLPLGLARRRAVGLGGQLPRSSIAAGLRSRTLVAEGLDAARDRLDVVAARGRHRCGARHEQGLEEARIARGERVGIAQQRRGGDVGLRAREVL